MVGKARENVTESPKSEVGEIDTRAPFESVKAAVSLFGEGAFAPGKHIVRKPKPPSTERAFVKETELHFAQKELNKFKEQLKNAETTRIQALAELEKAKRTVEDLTYKLKAITESKELAIKATETAKLQSKQTEEASSGGNAENGGSWRHELDTARDQYAVAIAELDAMKQELRQTNKYSEASINDKVSAIQQEAEAKQLADANKEKAAQLSNDIATLQDSLVHVKLATAQAQQEESKILSEKDDCRQSYRLALGEFERKLSTLKKEFNPEFVRSLEENMAETSSEIGVIKKEMENARASDLDSVTSMTTELDGAKGVLQKVAEEESSLRSLLELLKVELESVKKEHQDLREKEAETEFIAGNLHMELQKKMAELEMATSGESKARAACQDLISALQQLSSESENAGKEAETMKRSAAELSKEAESARIALDEAEKNLHVSLRDAEAAKSTEANALNQIKILSEKTNAARSSTSEFGAKITISAHEYESLNRKVEESDSLAKMKVAAAMAQVEAVRASENEAIKRLEAGRKEMEEIAVATEEALKRAEMAEAARRAVEGEMRRWREREQEKARDVASRLLAETQMSTEESQPQDQIRKVLNLPEKSERGDKTSVSKRTLLTNISGIFQRKRNQVEGRSPSYLPGEGPI